jgi:FSR family fosmidomycin resistance protein-like MFS transporter
MAEIADVALPPVEDVSGRQAKRMAVIIIIGHALKHMYTSGFQAVLLPEIKLGLNLSSTQVGTMATLQQFSSWGSTVTSGYVGDRFVGKTALMLGLSLALIGASYFTLASADSYALLLPGMVLLGLGPSIYHPPAIGALSRRFVRRRAFYISLHGTGGSVGEAVGPLVAGGLLALLFWRHVLDLTAIPAFITAFAMWGLLKNDKSDHHGASSLKEYLGSFKELLRIRSIQMIYLATAFRSVGQATTTVFLPIYMREDLGYSAWLAGVYISMAQVAGIGSQPLMGYLTDRIGYKRVLVPALVCFAVVLTLIPLADGKVQLAVVVLLLGTFLFSLHSILIASAAEFAGESMQATTVSLIYAASFVGALAPTIAGVLTDAYGFGSAFVFAAVLVSLSAVTLVFTKLPGSRATRTM